jgi:hypothetical protein
MRRSGANAVRAKAIVAAVVVVAMMSGCATRQARRTGTAVSVAAAVTGVGSLTVAGFAFFLASAGGSGCHGEICNDSDDSEDAVVIFGIAGVALLLSGLVGAIAFSSTEQPRDKEEARRREFWCQRDAGICANDQITCGRECLSAKSVWCAPYKAIDGEPGLLCGLSSDACFVLATSDHNRRGRESFGECSERTEPLPLSGGTSPPSGKPAPQVTQPGATP